MRMRIPVVPAALFLGVLAAGAAYWMKGRAHVGQPDAQPGGQQRSQSTSAPEDFPVQVGHELPAIAPAGRSSVAVKAAVPAALASPAAAQPARPQASAYTRQLVDSLASLDPSKVPRTPEEATAWKQNLQLLIQQGAAAVPAIQELLEKNVDLGFGKEGGDLLGYASARYAMFDALRQIGGTEAAGAMVGVLQSSADPREIALLAQDLEQMAPGEHSQEVLEAARQTLAMDAAGKRSPNAVPPSFHLFPTHGAANPPAHP